MSIYRLVYLLQNRNDYDDSSALYQKASSGFEKMLGVEHPTTLVCSKDYTLALGGFETVKQQSLKYQKSQSDTIIDKPRCGLCGPIACLGAVPSGKGKRIARNLCAVYFVVGVILFSVIRFLGCCFVVRGLEDSGVHTAT